MPVSLVKLDYANHLESLHDQYQPKALALLRRIRDLLVEEGFDACEPYDFSDDSYRWSMTARRPGDPDENLVDLTIEIAEERDYDDAEGWGINFGLDIVHYEGRILGGLTPYNWSPEVWVDSRNPNAVEELWTLLDQADIDTIPALVASGTDQQDAG